MKEDPMARLRDDLMRMKPEIYAQSVEIRTTYADIDSFQHLNNVAIARFFEEGRAHMNMALFGVDAVVRPTSSLQLMFASVTIDYVSQGEYPGAITVGTSVSHIGRTSYVQSGGLFQRGRCVALCDAVTVYAVDGKPVPIPDDVTSTLKRLKLKI
jgi:acyl-CoA thioester hydrolase